MTTLQIVGIVLILVVLVVGILLKSVRFHQPGSGFLTTFFGGHFARCSTL